MRFKTTKPNGLLVRNVFHLISNEEDGSPGGENNERYQHSPEIHIRLNKGQVYATLSLLDQTHDVRITKGMLLNNISNIN